MDELENIGCGCGCDEEVEDAAHVASFKPIEDKTDNAVKQGISITCTTCCEKQQEVTFNPCEDVKDITIQDVLLKGECRFLKVRVNLDKVCVGRKIALAVIVCENIGGTFITKGMRACEFTVPGTVAHCTENVNVGEFCFVFPEEDLCNTRRFKINVVAHYSSFPSFPFCPC